MLTRTDYIAHSERLHRTYYAAIANDIGITWPDADMPWLTKKLACDKNLNNVPLPYWDNLALTRVRTHKGYIALKERGDTYSLSNGVCALKASVWYAVQVRAAATAPFITCGHLTLFAINSGELYEAHKRLARHPETLLSHWERWAKQYVLPLYWDQIEPVRLDDWAALCVATELSDYYAQHLKGMVGVQ